MCPPVPNPTRYIYLPSATAYGMMPLFWVLRTTLLHRLDLAWGITLCTTCGATATMLTGLLPPPALLPRLSSTDAAVGEHYRASLHARANGRDHSNNAGSGLPAPPRGTAAFTLRFRHRRLPID